MCLINLINASSSLIGQRNEQERNRMAAEVFEAVVAALDGDPDIDEFGFYGGEAGAVVVMEHKLGLALALLPTLLEYGVVVHRRAKGRWAGAAAAAAAAAVALAPSTMPGIGDGDGGGAAAVVASEAIARGDADREDGAVGRGGAEGSGDSNDLEAAARREDTFDADVAMDRATRVLLLLNGYYYSGWSDRKR
jgi:hypothetical protein